MTGALSAAPLTVAGQPLVAAYDTVLAHEHLFVDLRCWLDAGDDAERRLRDVPVHVGTLPEVRAHPYACIDNLQLTSASLLAGELRELRYLGRTLLVVVTPPEIGRDVEGMAELSRALNIDLVYGCGPYLAVSRPQDAASVPAEAYRDRILREFDGPGPHPAVIGEIGTSDPIQPEEVAALRGAALAQAQLGVPLYVHLYPWARHGHAVLDVVERAGGDVSRTVLCHLDTQVPGGLGYHRELLGRGAVLGFDLWGDEFTYGGRPMPSDAQRVRATVELVQAGFGAQLVHSHGIATKIRLRRFGGHGYAHLSGPVARGLREAGLDAAEVRRQLAGNALALLTGAARG